MPELPEVETIRQDLRSKILSKKISDVQIRKGKLVKNQNKVFVNELINNKFIEIDRVGKLLIFVLPQNYVLIHLKMTGQLIYKNKNEITAGGHSQSNMDFIVPNKFTHIIINFFDGSKLFFNDMRQFGYMKLVNDKDRQVVVAKYGKEPIADNFTWDYFNNLFKNKKVILKALLLDQRLIAGIGNIYADEICFAAGVRPQRRVNTLKLEERKKIFKASVAILKKGIKYRGTTFSDYVDSFGRSGGFVKHLKVFGRQNQQCKRCKSNNIVKIKVVGRGTHYCPNCQK